MKLIDFDTLGSKVYLNRRNTASMTPQVWTHWLIFQQVWENGTPKYTSMKISVTQEERVGFR
jgi:hypothetical protein